jgi:hypothetical protein
METNAVTIVTPADYDGAATRPDRRGGRSPFERSGHRDQHAEQTAGDFADVRPGRPQGEGPQHDCHYALGRCSAKEEVIVVLQISDADDAWCQRLRGPVTEALMDLGLPGPDHQR